tara:strand:+ start:355 stop:525 length:171 start_codon:yes stop_codon:yes gene_type:complete
MTRYQVHYSVGRPKGLHHGKRTIKARSEAEAIIKVKSVVQGSFGHWVTTDGYIEVT